MSSGNKKTFTRPDTVLATAGRDPDNNFGIVNPPVYHASTILSPTMDKFENRIPFEGYGYGRNGTPTQKALEDAAPESAQKNINLAMLRNLDVPVPPIKLQREFARRVTAVERLKTAHRASLAELDALFATLQHRAFRGELGVPAFGVPPSGGKAHERKGS